MKLILLLTVLAIAASSVTAISFCDVYRNGVQLPHPDCGKFYVCQNRIPVVKQCAAGLHFSPTKFYCEAPSLAGCDPSIKPIPKPEPVDTAKECKGQPLGKRIAYPNVCEKFIVCIGGGVVQECPDDLHFSERLQVCDWPQSADCRFPESLSISCSGMQNYNF